ncbi:tRNA (guanine-N(7)-)-methyltransferase [Actinomyces sp. Chiba101]|uniref:tRNA (guanine-N(7)-)-methyltransferase n=1 Tax=Actinomyces denticolens TaxID=52767 RepID=A0ABY1I448_9ACTO|nr:MULTISPECIES: tRNA (guanosine(46)-N7)-methyltransferase TrmB [Actinomyces]BAW92900.1 tRNA (guanine-N(7)-)-methyltransferase [Actinomyces sp. Chiba101]GAV94119.1 tRNA (guanine-N(7)-)-methyltransferase [Actinomyces denticolens]SHI56795.1 tRNA (guanine-N7-)-methyltransferase [Actinomyces denticolens]SUU06371.1 tRNA (guanine-N(7)-)-methyltransferase [Actinomyces denticolens]
MQQHPPRSHAIHSRVRSYSRAGGRLSGAQAEALAELAPRYVVDVPRRDAVRTVAPGFRLDPEALFGHQGSGRPLVVEIGSGSGEAILAHAAAHPGVDHLAVEVWETAIARLVASIHRQGLHNVRVVPADGAELLATALPVGCASEVWVFFPDPWRKARHRKRRLVNTAFADSVARVLRPGGVWRLATDWADYAWQMRDVLEGASALPEGIEADSTGPYFRYDDAGARPDLGAATAVAGDAGNGVDPGSPSGARGGWSERFAGRAMTRFEQRGIDEGRTIRDLTAVRTEEQWIPAARPTALERLDDGAPELFAPEGLTD